MNAKVIVPLALVAGLAAGCAADPAGGLLEPGSEAMTFDGSGDAPRSRIAIDRPDKLGLIRGSGLDMIETGTRVRIAGDPGPAEEAWRGVTVRILEGEKAGVQATLPRRNLRPLPR